MLGGPRFFFFAYYTEISLKLVDYQIVFLNTHQVGCTIFTNFSTRPTLPANQNQAARVQLRFCLTEICSDADCSVSSLSKKTCVVNTTIDSNISKTLMIMRYDEIYNFAFS